MCLYQNVESKLATFPMRDAGLMTKEEYMVAMENIAPLANEQLLGRLTTECMHSAGSELVQLKRLAGERVVFV